MTTALKTAAWTKFETECCSRCGGSGSYSWCQSHGSTCFKCGGRGEVHTARGSAALQFATDALSKPAGEIRVGETFLYRGIQRSSWVRVTGVSAPSCYQDDATNAAHVTIGYAGGSSTVARTDATRMTATPERKRAVISLALEYQDTLTKRGKVRKARTTHAADLVLQAAA